MPAFKSGGMSDAPVIGAGGSERSRKRSGSADKAPKGSALDAALRILGVRDHSVMEMEKKLQARGFEEAEIATTIERLVDYKYLDDQKFASLVARSRTGLGRRGLAHEMQKRGIAPETWRPIVEAMDDEEELSRALEAARKHTSPSKIASLDRDVWQRRLSGFLARRGFSSHVVRSVCSTLEEEALTEGDHDLSSVISSPSEGRGGIGRTQW